MQLRIPFSCLLLLVAAVVGKPYSKEVAILRGDSVYETFKQNLIRYYDVSEDFAQEFKDNLKKAVLLELDKNSFRQGNLDEDEDEDEVTVPTTTTEGPGAFNIVNGIYGILKGIGTLSPDSVFASTLNFFPPSRKETAQALINSALGQKVSFPTPTTTIPTSSTPSTSTKDDDYDEDDETTKAPVAVAAVVTQATLAPVIEKYTLKPKEGAAAAAAVAVTSAPAVSNSGSTVQDDEVDLSKLGKL